MRAGTGCDCRALNASIQEYADKNGLVRFDCYSVMPDDRQMFKREMTGDGLFARFLQLPGEQMNEIVDYTNSGRPIVALRTSTHAFNYQKRKDSPYAKYGHHGTEFEGGYGRQVLGETWVSHYGAHQKESTRGLVAPGMEKHPIPRGVKDVWGEPDVRSITTLSADSKPLLMGQVPRGMRPSCNEHAGAVCCAIENRGGGFDRPRTRTLQRPRALVHRAVRAGGVSSPAI